MGREVQRLFRQCRIAVISQRTNYEQYKRFRQHRIRSTKESIERNKGDKYLAVFRRIEDPAMIQSSSNL